MLLSEGLDASLWVVVCWQLMLRRDRLTQGQSSGAVRLPTDRCWKLMTSSLSQKIIRKQRRNRRCRTVCVRSNISTPCNTNLLSLVYMDESAHLIWNSVSYNFRSTELFSTFKQTVLFSWTRTKNISNSFTRTRTRTKDVQNNEKWIKNKKIAAELNKN